MKIAVSFPTTFQLVEKLGGLFGELHLIGFNGEYSSEKRYETELPNDLGMKLHFRREHYSEIEPNEYDLLIDSWETRNYNPEWREWSLKWRIPRILKVLWHAKPERIDFSEEEKEILSQSLVSTENFYLEEKWKSAGFDYTKVLLYPPGPWWFDGEWTGEVERLLYVLSGVGAWRDTVSTGFEMWQKIERLLPDQTYHQDGYKNYVSSRGLAKMFRKHRCYTNLDRTHKARPLCLVFTEAISAGTPPIVLNCEYTDYARYIEHGISGYICENASHVAECAKKLLEDRDLAESMSNKIRSVARDNFSEEVLKPVWDEAIQQAVRLA